MAEIINAFLEQCFILGMAFLLKQLGYLNTDDGKKAINIIVNWFVPMTMIANLSKLPWNPDFLILPAISWSYAAATLPMFAFIFRRLYPNDWRLLFLCCVGQAVTLVGYPVLSGFYGQDGLSHCIYFDLGNFFVAYPGSFVLALLLAPNASAPASESLLQDDTQLNFGGAKRRDRAGSDTSLSGVVGNDLGKDTRITCAYVFRRVFFLAPTLGFLIGATFRATSSTPEKFLPDFISSGMAASATCTSTITLFALGAFFEPGLLLQREYIGRLATLLLVRFGCALLFGLVLYAALLKTADPLIAITARVDLVMPIPPVVIAYAVEFGYDVPFAALAVNMNLFVSFILAFLVALASQ